MTGTVLERSLNAVIGRLQKLRILRRQTACWLLLLIPAIIVTLWLPRNNGVMGPEVPVVLGTTVVGILLARLFVKNPSMTEAARLVEQTDPELNDAVLTAVQLSTQSPGHRLTVMGAMAVHDADVLARNSDWSSAVPGRQVMKWTVLSFLSFVIMVSSVMAASRYGRDLIKPLSVEAVAETKPTATPVTELVIEPGDTELERGTSLTVVARFPGVVPTRAMLEFVDSENATRQMGMTETVDAGVFAARMEEIISDGTYRVLYEESEVVAAAPQSSPTFEVKTYVRPKLEQVDAIVSPPAWAGRPQEVIEDVMRLTATEGSTVVLKLRLNKAVAVAELRTKDGEPIVLAASASEPTAFETTIVVNDSNAWTVHLQDAEGRTAADEEQISIKVTRNQPANIKAVFPGRDTNVSPLQEFLVEAKASDDFGIVNYGVQYSLSGGALKERSLGDVKPTTFPAIEPTAAEPARPEATSTESSAIVDTSAVAAPVLNAVMSHRIELEPMSAAPDDLVTYSFWASDIAADGTERRTYSDILFADVRRFEEIFRESEQNNQQQQQQQQQQQNQQGSPIDGVLKLQKEIISATWNTIRAEAEKRRTGSFAEDVGVIAESQAQAIEQLHAALAEAGDDPKVAALAEKAMQEMASAKTKLDAVGDGEESARLADAMPIEQSVVQTLLKMRAAETNVRQQQQGGGGGGGGSSSAQQQLQQLELDNKRNRYESEQQAQQQQEQTQQQRDQLQVLNRLKELARRQQMVNERLKELESELRAATTDKEREEIERELKRLRDEQREMLRDVDELSEKMDQVADRQKPESAQMQQQMEEARTNVQQASRAMDEGKLAEAISEGTRAERQFEDLKEEFRNQTSSKFDEAVRDLRDQARALSEQEEKLARQLTGEGTEDDKNKKPSLKSDRNREELQKQFGEQRDRLNRVVDDAKKMVEQAEQSEPLLSNKLYDALRDLKDTKPQEALEATELLAGRGMWSQSQQAEQAARKGIDQLRKGIEQAADSVLGSEAESLRRAQSQLQNATEKLASEVQAATGEKGTADSTEPGSQQDESGQPGKSGENANDESKKSSPYGDSSDSAKPTRRPGQRGQQGQPTPQEERGEGGQKSQSEQSQTGKPSDGEQPNGQGEGEQAGQQQPGGQGQPQGEESGEQGQPGEQTSEQSKDGGQQAGQKSGQGQGQGQGQQGGQAGKGDEPQDGQSQPGEQQAQQGEGQQPGEGQKSQQGKGQGQQQGGGQGGGENQPRSSSLRNGGREGNGRATNNVEGQPLTGDEYGKWSDQLRDIEEMLDDPELRNRVAQVRDRARAIRADFKRHGEEPQWDLVKSQLLGEMQSLQQRINQELSKLESDRAMVPIDREPVPEEFDSLVQRYYELLGQERSDEEPAKK